ncbi:2'-5' RNA ligase [Methanothermus fervidus DSM 2088]|uniref:RNA 2',3'-cyclic phosphodiesterase n=1 Tax=Methanothermus fervidus (strain ATCC 43054 / DSM 2088 / JCM 10308 / V24 S) TaxID=523846 RepID=E3GYL9_METFV|nr:RNA 2',3'-cyclic phosphodiesterase [Methanothermus fervidus]ADP77401.1 2'-5' RNA ligase [Methanothermus fervidus DSM 2088]
MRTFLAIDLDSELHQKVIEIQKKLKETKADIKFVTPENLHFTLKFFGNIDEKQLNEISNIVKKSIEDFHEFELHLKGIGVFPNKKYIRVIWIGVDNPEYFIKLQKKLDIEFNKIGFDLERDYVPHLTIGRVKTARNKDRLIKKINELENVTVGSMKVKELSLKKSILRPEGPKYKDLQIFTLSK